jgi:hypothetical protein
MEGDCERTYTSGEFFRKDHSHYKRTKITLNPDHDKLGSFDDPLENLANDPELKNGTRVQILGRVRVKGVWQDGHAVDDSGKVMDVRSAMATTKPSLVGKPLPSLSDLSRELSQVQAEARPLLLSLVDIEQRLSRQYLSNLAKKTENLTAEGVMPVIIQVSRVDLQQYEDWVKANRIEVPIRVAEGDFESRKAAWGVKALPWLILTDKDRIVKAEGFAAGELEKVLGTGVTR